MPTHENMRVASGLGGATTDVTDKVPERHVRESGELQGHLGHGPIPGTVNSYVANTPDTSEVALGVDPTLAVPTGVSAATGAGAAGTVALTVTALGAGNTGWEAIVRKASDGSFIGKRDATATGASTITGLPAATSVTIDVRGYVADGRVGKAAARVTVTTHA